MFLFLGLSYIGMELISLIVESSDAVSQVLFFLKSCGSFSENSALVNTLVAAHLVSKVSYQFRFIQFVFFQEIWLLFKNSSQCDGVISIGKGNAIII